MEERQVLGRYSFWRPLLAGVPQGGQVSQGGFLSLESPHNFCDSCKGCSGCGGCSSPRISLYPEVLHASCNSCKGCSGCGSCSA